MSVIVVGVLPLEEDAENLGPRHHGGAGQEAVPGEEAERGVNGGAPVGEMRMMVNEELGQQGQQQDACEDHPQFRQVFGPVEPVFLGVADHVGIR